MMTPRQENAQRRVAELLAELTDIIGPADDGQADRPEGVTLWDWTVVACWIDKDRQDFYTVLPAEGMLTHHVAGLLRAGLAYAALDPAN